MDTSLVAEWALLTYLLFKILFLARAYLKLNKYMKHEMNDNLFTIVFFLPVETNNAKNSH